MADARPSALASVISALKRRITPPSASKTGQTPTFLPRTFFIAATIATACAAEISLFPEHTKTLSAETMPYMPMLHSGIENDTFYMRGRFGVDFPVAGYRVGNDAINFGINAAAHINMMPEDGGRFPVDNFYATLAIYFSGTRGSKFSWRFYPVYHVSAHLADGHPADIMKTDVRPVSSEMIRGEAYYKPFGSLIELGAGAGWYYHVCAQKELDHRADMSILVTPNRIVGNLLQPFALLRVEAVRQGEYRAGVDASAGVFAINAANRGLGLSLRYFDRLHSSYYFEKYEKGYGLELMFMF